VSIFYLFYNFLGIIHLRVISSLDEISGLMVHPKLVEYALPFEGTVCCRMKQNKFSKIIRDEEISMINQ